MKTGSINVQNLHERLGVIMVEFMCQSVELANKFAFLPCDISGHGVVTLQHVAQVLDFIHPGEGVTIEEHWSHILPIPHFLGGNYALCFYFL